MNIDITVVGSLNRDLVVRLSSFPKAGETVPGTDLQTFSGGKGANQSYAAAMLGAKAAMAGQVGADDAGTEQVRHLNAAGVDTRWVMRDENAPTGTAIILLEERGQNRIVAVPGANNTFTPDKLAGMADLLAASRVVLLQLEIPLDTVARAVELARRGRALVILDPAPARHVPDALLRNAHYLTPNSSELSALCGVPVDDFAPEETIRAAAQALIKRGAPKVIAKLGARGAMLITENSVEKAPAFPVQAVDTTAAGDCFNAAFAVALLRAKSERDALRFACAAAALSVTRAGAQAAMPSLCEVEALLQKHKDL